MPLHEEIRKLSLSVAVGPEGMKMTPEDAAALLNISEELGQQLTVIRLFEQRSAAPDPDIRAGAVAA